MAATQPAQALHARSAARRPGATAAPLCQSLAAALPATARALRNPAGVGRGRRGVRVFAVQTPPQKPDLASTSNKAEETSAAAVNGTPEVAVFAMG